MPILPDHFNRRPNTKSDIIAVKCAHFDNAPTVEAAVDDDLKRAQRIYNAAAFSKLMGEYDRCESLVRQGDCVRLRALQARARLDRLAS